MTVMRPPQQIDHWCRVIINRATAAYVAGLKPEMLDVLEISGSAWQSVGFRSYKNVIYPDFDICRQRLTLTFDLIIRTGI